MERRPGDFVRALLPLIPLGFCHACGGGTESPSAGAQPAISASQVASNAPPTIVLAAIDDAQVGTTFDYKPTATDPDSDVLHFTAVNLPAWASLDSSTGRISGTPGPSDTGVYESISITVADATHSVATAPFSITVNAAVETDNGIASLRWEAPSSKVSGEPLDDLAGYRILYGRSSSDLDLSVLIGDPAITSYEFSTLASGVWYFAVVAVNSGGLEGPPTSVVNKSM